MTAEIAPRRGRRQQLLMTFSDQYGDAMRRRQSAVALRAARVDAELAYRARGSFLASMNHELRTPLNAITGFAGLLRHTDETGISTAQRQEYLDYILQSADLLLSHINTILEIADAESGGMKLSRRAFDLGDVLTQVAERMRTNDLTFVLDIEDGLPPVDADPDKVAAAVRHLVEFLREPASGAVAIGITVRRGVAGKSAEHIYVAMESSGPGHSPAEIDTALRVFDRVQDGLDRRFETRRLGLPIAKSYIELNNGRFNVKPLNDAGTLIRFALQVAVQDHQQLHDRLAS